MSVLFPVCGEGNQEDTRPEPEGLMLVGCVVTMCPDHVPPPGLGEMFLYHSFLHESFQFCEVVLGVTCGPL